MVRAVDRLLDRGRWDREHVDRGVTTRVPADLLRPLPKIIRDWTRASPGEDLPASRTTLENAIAVTATQFVTASGEAQDREVADEHEDGSQACSRPIPMW